MLAESFLKHSDNQIKLSAIFSDGFKEQIELLERLKIDHEFVKLETENRPEINATKIIEAIENSRMGNCSKSVLGAPVASAFNNNELLKQSGDSLLEWIGGNSQGMSSLTIEERALCMKQESVKTLIDYIRSRIHLINYASCKTNVIGVDTPLELFRNFTDEKEGMNDGVVPLKSALMKEHGFDVEYIIEAEVDHLMTMTHYYLSTDNYNSNAHTISVLKQLL